MTVIRVRAKELVGLCGVWSADCHRPQTEITEEIEKLKGKRGEHKEAIQVIVRRSASGSCIGS